MMVDFLHTFASNLYAIVVTLLLFSLTIFVHELGHFLVARWCGLVVDAFSIGFGPALWQRKINGVVYKIGILPLGGYVALPQLDPSGGNPHKAGEGARELPRVGPFKRILVSLAGVTCNMILAFALAYIVFWGGKSFTPEKTNVVGFVETNSLAAASGFAIGDEILRVADREVHSWEDFIMGVALADKPTVTVRRLTGTEEKIVPLTTNEMGANYVEGMSAVNQCMVLQVVPGSKAEAAGLQPQDIIVTFAGQTLFSREHLSSLIATRCDQSVPATFLRKGQEVKVELMPTRADPASRPLIGIMWNNIDVTEPVTQIKQHLKLILGTLKALVTPAHAGKAAQGLGGPVKIIEILWYSVKASFILALWFTIALNVNLAVMNLLPLPVLDGGHIVFALWEAITRRAASPKVVNILWNAFAGLLIFAMLFLTVRDLRGCAGRSHTGADSASSTNKTSAGDVVEPAASPTNRPAAVPAP